MNILKSFADHLLSIAVFVSVFGIGQAMFKGLGSHSSPSKGATVLAGKFPPPSVLYYHFVKSAQPLLMKNVLEETMFPAFTKWTDEYLDTHYGQEIMRIEKGKKENRSRGVTKLHLSMFLHMYKTSDWYMVQTLPDSMKGDVMVPYSLRCGGFQNNLQEVVVWFSGGDTRSVLHYDALDNIVCLLDGKKKLVLIDKMYSDMITADGFVEAGTYSLVDVDGVDPIRFPGVMNAPWYQINMEKGDCVFIPYKWFHYIYSSTGRNLAMNFWFSHLWWFNNTDCEDLLRENEPLTNFNMVSPNQQLRSDFLSTFAGVTDVSRQMFAEKSICGIEETDKMFDKINNNGDKLLTWSELYSFNIDETVQQFPTCFHFGKVNNNRTAPIKEDQERNNTVRYGSEKNIKLPDLAGNITHNEVDTDKDDIVETTTLDQHLDKDGIKSQKNSIADKEKAFVDQPNENIDESHGDIGKDSSVDLINENTEEVNSDRRFKANDTEKVDSHDHDEF